MADPERSKGGAVCPDLGTRLNEFLMPCDRMEISAGVWDRGAHVLLLRELSVVNINH